MQCKNKINLMIEVMWLVIIKNHMQIIISKIQVMLQDKKA